MGALVPLIGRPTAEKIKRRYYVHELVMPNFNEIPKYSVNF
jgi:hypothetical protein